MALESRRVHGLVARSGVPTSEPNPRIIVNPTVPDSTVPVFKGAPGTYRELIGAARLSVTDEGVHAEMELPPYLAAELLADSLHAHVEGWGGMPELSYNPETGGRDAVIDGMRINSLYCSSDPGGWPDLKLEEA